MTYYLESGYVDMERLIRMNYPFIFLLGGRGTGKTYGACKYLLEHPEQKFMYLRRIQQEADAIGNPEFSPFQPVINDHPELQHDSAVTRGEVYRCHKKIYDNIKSGDSHGAYQALIEHSDLMIKDLLETIK